MPLYKYYYIYKPYQMMSQFSTEGTKLTLKDINYNFEKDIYPVGRLDYDSEGLLLLTNDKKLTKYLLEPKYKHEREYYVQVEGNITQEAIISLQKGVEIQSYKTLPAKVKIIEEPLLPERNPPIRFRATIPTTWISITLVEGKNRQVRRMTAAVGFPTLRLIRMRIEKLLLQDIQPGTVKEIQQNKIKKLFNLMT